MGSFTVHRVVAASAQRTWEVLTDWPRHSGTVPLTRVRALPAPGGDTQGEGSGLVARTGLGRLAYDDRMTVTEWRAPTATTPGRCRLRKQGHAVSGGACFTVTALAPRRCRVVWQEQADVAGLHSLPGGPFLEAAVGRVVFARALRLLARQAEAA
jgi:hypothetical protein